MGSDLFVWDERLRIHTPRLELEWEQYDGKEQSAIIARWELIRGAIPDRVKELEALINRLQDELGDEACFERSCELNAQIAEYASRINDLLIWYRSDQQLDSRRHS